MRLRTMTSSDCLEPQIEFELPVHYGDEFVVSCDGGREVGKMFDLFYSEHLTKSIVMGYIDKNFCGSKIGIIIGLRDDYLERIYDNYVIIGYDRIEYFERKSSDTMVDFYDLFPNLIEDVDDSELFNLLDI